MLSDILIDTQVVIADADAILSLQLTHIFRKQYDRVFGLVNDKTLVAFPRSAVLFVRLCPANGI